jgi:hypothetical protein
MGSSPISSNNNIAEWSSWSARLAHNQEVVINGSNPTSAIFLLYNGLAQMGEHQFFKQEVAGSRPSLSILRRCS